MDDKYGESSLENALPWTSITPAQYKVYDDLTGILPVVEQRSQQRLSGDQEFKYLLEDIATMREARDQTKVSLLENARREELAKEEELRSVRKAAREAFAGNGGSDVKLLSTTNPDVPQEALSATLKPPRISKMRHQMSCSTKPFAFWAILSPWVPMVSAQPR